MSTVQKKTARNNGAGLMSEANAIMAEMRAMPKDGTEKDLLTLENILIPKMAALVKRSLYGSDPYRHYQVNQKILETKRDRFRKNLGKERS